MFTITVSFLRYMAIARKCRVCHRHYLAAMEEDCPGVCGGCLSIAYPSPMEEEFLPVRQLVREIQSAL